MSTATGNSGAPRSAGTAPLWLALPALLAMLPTGCVESVDHVVVEITAEGLDMPEELDTLEVTVAAASDSSGTEICIPHTTYYSLDPVDATHITLPFELEISPGATYDKLVYVRVVGRKSQSIRFKTERAASLAGGDSVIHVPITADCLGTGTGTGQYCQGGVAIDSSYAVIFDDDRYWNGDACVDSN